MKPKQEKRIAIGWSGSLFKKPGKYCIQAFMKLKESKKWTDAGHEIDFGQTVFNVGEKCNKFRWMGSWNFFMGMSISVSMVMVFLLFSKDIGSLD